MDYLGLSFDQGDEEAMVRRLRARNADSGFAYLVTPNVDHVVRLSKLDQDSAEWRAYRNAAWRLCDSRILSALAARRGIHLPVVTGSDLTARLFRDVAAPGDRICLIGGQPGDIEALAAIRPDISIVQHIPPRDLCADAEGRATAARFLAASAARFSLIAVGSPQQELIAAAAAAIPEARGTALCVGASIDFLTGRARRAPRWMQRSSLEWLHRLLLDPWRLWRRYLLDGPRIFLLAWRAGR
ncbi:glycosyl transferase [Sphingomonas sp. Root710]|uniref:WecB/TagA/CpsF family glycosyltransferase n=1 Tax=Sphingomonas sp. Root710 TaxID=1736594 RepID=UPI0006FA1755|nr:WecB/TagA/CpsF family glycosyltransferase [Sphingomonas sp. Root710]KRB86344.1 glycosyl transferase [Sphingomonas sp. Root710]